MNKLQKFLSSALQVRGVNLSGSNNMFGSIATNNFPLGNFGFIPTDGNGGTLNLTEGNVNPQWIGLESINMQYWAYNYCSPLAAVIDRLAEADTNGRIDFVDADGHTLKNVNKNPKLLRIKRLLAKPNPMQTWEEFNSQQLVICKTHGYCPVFALGAAGMDKSYTKYLFNLSPVLCLPQQNAKYDMMSTDNSETNPISSWTITIFGKTYTIPASDIILIKDGYMDKTNGLFNLPLSKVAGLDYFVSNICAAMEADNVLLKKKGPLGIFSYDPKPDMAGWTPMDPVEKDELQNDLKQYGLTTGQLQYIISKIPMKWNAMSFNLRDLMTKETVRQGIDGICDRLGYPAELMSGKNATYENRSSAEKYLYQNNTIPFSLRRMARYNEFFGLEDQLLYMDYDHLPVLQEDIVHAGEAYKAQAEGIDILWKGGLLTFNDVMRKCDMDTITGMDIYYPEWAKKNGIELNPQKASNGKKQPKN